MSFYTWARENRELAIAAIGFITAIIGLISAIIGRHKTTTVRHETITPRPAGTSGSLSSQDVATDEKFSWGDLGQMLLGVLVCTIATVLFPLMIAAVFVGWHEISQTFGQSLVEVIVRIFFMVVFFGYLWIGSTTFWLLPFRIMKKGEYRPGRGCLWLLGINLAFNIGLAACILIFFPTWMK